MSSTISTRPSSPKLGERDDVNGLETWDDPIPRRSQWTVQDLCDAFVAASKHHLSLIPQPPPREERARRRQERERSFLLNVALRKYATQNNIQHSELQLVEVKARNYVFECPRAYLHYNILVRCPDGTHTMFFAEVDPERAGEEDVHLCTPLQDATANNKGPCFSCKHRARGLMHPTGAAYLGGHMETNFLDFELPDSSDDEYI